MTSSSRWLTALICLYLGLGLIYDWATPIFEATDEGYHFAAIRWIARGNGLPIQRVGQPAEWAQEGSQPPLYNWLAAGLTFWIDTSDWADTFVRNPFLHHIPGTPHNVNFYRHTARESFVYHGTVLAVHVVRWFSLLLGAATIGLTHRLARSLFPAREWLALLAAALVALNPKMLFVSASVNNDNLLMLVSTATLLTSVHLMQAPAKRFEWKAAGLGLLLGLAALTKVSGLVLWPLAGVALVGARGIRNWELRIANKELRIANLKFEIWNLILESSLVFGLALLVCGWWFWRNYQSYGEWLGLKTMVAIAGPRIPPLSVWEVIRQEWVGFYLSYWSIFGVFTIRPPEWIHLLFYAITLWAIAGVTWRFIRRGARLRPELALLALFCALTLMGVINWTLQTKASQGRLLFGAIAPLSIFMAAGLLTTVRLERARAVSLTIAGVMGLIAAVTPILYIAPLYAPPRLIAESDLPEALRPVRATFGGAIDLIGYVADDTARHPGEAQPVTLYWRALKPMTMEYALALLLLGRGTTEVVGKLDTWPGGGTAPTSLWKPGDIFADHYWLTIDSLATTPSLLRLVVKFWAGDSENTLPAQTPTGETIPSVTLAVGRLTPLAPPDYKPALALASTFDDDRAIKLVGMDTGDGGAFTLYWQADRPISADYTVFAHLMDANGQQVAQDDSQPLKGDWPTSAWMTGQMVADARQLTLPAALPPGRYTLQVGLYELATQTRLAAFHPDGTPWQDNIVVLENVMEIR